MTRYFRHGVWVLALLAGINLAGAQTTNVDIGLQLSPEQREKVYQALVSAVRPERERAVAPEPGQYLVVGSPVPETLEIHDMPEEAVAEIPEMKSYKYMVVQNEVLIVEPESRKVVEIIHR